jgi:hypothetical protein
VVVEVAVTITTIALSTMQYKVYRHHMSPSNQQYRYHATDHMLYEEEEEEDVADGRAVAVLLVVVVVAIPTCSFTIYYLLEIYIYIFHHS